MIFNSLWSERAPVMESRPHHQDWDRDQDLIIRDRDRDRDLTIQDRDHPFRDRDRDPIFFLSNIFLVNIIFSLGILESTNDRVFFSSIFFHLPPFRSCGLDRVVSSKSETFEPRDRDETETFERRDRDETEIHKIRTRDETSVTGEHTS